MIHFFVGCLFISCLFTYFLPESKRSGPKLFRAAPTAPCPSFGVPLPTVQHGRYLDAGPFAVSAVSSSSLHFLLAENPKTQKNTYLLQILGGHETRKVLGTVSACLSSGPGNFLRTRMRFGNRERGEICMGKRVCGSTVSHLERMEFRIFFCRPLQFLRLLMQQFPAQRNASFVCSTYSRRGSQGVDRVLRRFCIWVITTFALRPSTCPAKFIVQSSSPCSLHLCLLVRGDRVTVFWLPPAPSLRCFVQDDSFPRLNAVGCPARG